MSAKRRVAAAAVVILLGSFTVSFALPQSLAEIAQKEKERRAAHKGKKAVVVTNADLAKGERKPAVEGPVTSPAASPVGAAKGSPPASAGGGPQEASSPPAATPPEAAASAPPAGLTAPAAISPTTQELQDKWNKAKEYVELLTLKMGALWQQFNGITDPHAKEGMRQTISETYAKLATAQEEETKARLEFEKSLGEAKKGSTPQIWIK